MTQSTSKESVGGQKDQLAEYSELHLPPLVRTASFKMTLPAYARLVTRSLCENSSEGRIIRRWMTRGAALEGISLNEPL